MNKKWWQNEVVYQIYPKSFCDSNHDGIGDLKGITSKLDYLKELGITMIWLCPIFCSPMMDNGYDISDYLNVAPEFGTKEELEELIEEAKKRNIKLILDLVLNHTSDEHAWFQEALANPESKYHDYYIFKTGKEIPNNWRSVFGGSVWEKVNGRDEYYFHSFGKKQPDLNWENPKLRQALYDMINTWSKMGIAGFRVDAITFIKKDLQFLSRESDGADGLISCTKVIRNHEGIEELLAELKKETFDRYDCMTVAEAAGLRYEQLKDFIGDQGFFSMVFDFKPADLDIASGSEWFKRIPWTPKDLENKMMTSNLEMQKHGWAANFIENHDQPRATTKYLRENHRNRDAVTMLASLYFFMRGTPYIYQGQELGMVNFEREGLEEFNDISSIDQYHRSLEEGFQHSEAMHFVNLRSRDNTRVPFPWDDGKYMGFSDVKPWLNINEQARNIHVKNQQNDENSVLHFYKKMIAFRQTGRYHDVMVYGTMEKITTENENVIAYRRRYEDTCIECYYNFSEQFVSLEKKASCELVFFNREEAKIVDDQMVLAPWQAALWKVRV